MQVSFLHIDNMSCQLEDLCKCGWMGDMLTKLCMWYLKIKRLNIIMEGKNLNWTLYDSAGILNVKHGTEIQFINQYDTL